MSKDLSGKELELLLAESIKVCKQNAKTKMIETSTKSTSKRPEESTSTTQSTFTSRNRRTKRKL